MSPIGVQLQRGDILSVQADVCVSSIHRSKDMKLGRLSNNILSRAGKSIQDEINTKQPGKELSIGQVEVVSPGKLRNVKELSFICLRKYKLGNEEILLQSILECLEIAAVKNYKTISFPALGTGQDYPPEEVIKCLLGAVEMHNLQYPNTSLDIVYIVLLDHDIELIKIFLMMCAKGTTYLQAENTMQSSDDKCNDDYASELCSVRNNIGIDQGTHEIPKPRIKWGPNVPKVAVRKNTGPQKAVKQSNGFVNFLSSVFSVKNGFTAQKDFFTFNIRPQFTNKRFGVQINAGIDISFLETFIPKSLFPLFNTLFS